MLVGVGVLVKSTVGDTDGSVSRDLGSFRIFVFFAPALAAPVN